MSIQSPAPAARHGGLLKKLLALTIALVLGTAVILAAASQYGLHTMASMTDDTYKKAMDDGYRTEIKSEVQSALAVCEMYYKQQQAGTLTEEQAKTAAKETIRGMRYRDDGSGYFWIDARDYTLVMHPVLTKKEGTNRKDLKDQNGVMIIQEIMNSTEGGQGGYNEFYFAKADGVTVAPKLAYSEGFAPWGWVITTGNYTDDMTAEMAATVSAIDAGARRATLLQLALSVLVILLAVLIAYRFAKTITQPINQVTGELGDVADGNLAFSVSPELLGRDDEIGSIGRSMKAVQDTLKDILGKNRAVSDSLDAESSDFRKAFNDITAAASPSSPTKCASSPKNPGRTPRPSARRSPPSPTRSASPPKKSRKSRKTSRKSRNGSRRRGTPSPRSSAAWPPSAPPPAPSARRPKSSTR